MATTVVGCSSKSPDSVGPAWESDSVGPAWESESVELVDGYPNPATWSEANKEQAYRAAKSFHQLRQRKVPVYEGPLFVGDVEGVRLQSPQEVAKRTLVLWAVELRAEGIPQQEAIGIIEKLDLWDAVSPEEKKFLKDANPDPEQSRQLVWRLESIWVLLWSLGYIDDLDWPSGMCDVSKLVEIIKPHESNTEFITGAKLRSESEILDAQDLILRIHWAIRDAHLNHDEMVPAALDWSSEGEQVRIELSPAVGVVEQRHYVLNWLVNFLDPKDWDNVDTPT
jgi:hypothetical protein